MNWLLHPMTETSIKSVDWYWLRHAPTGVRGRFNGRGDVPALTPIGTVPDLPTGAVWLTSPLLRCRQTAAHLKPPADELRVVEAFVEQDFGDWEGRGYDDPAIRDHAAFWADPGRVAPPGGESFADVLARIRPAIAREIDGATGPIVCVSHAGVIRAALALALDLDANSALRFHIAPLSTTKLTWFDSGAWQVDWINRT